MTDQVGMSDQPPEEAHRTGRSVRLDTLVRLRWLAVIGQTTAVLVVYFGLDYELPIWACLAVIALAAWLNVTLRIRFPMAQRLEPDRAVWLLAFDTAELAVLLFFTGGLQNPFALLFLGPVLISATALPARMTLMLGGFAVACATVLVFVHDPLPWDTEPPLELPQVYVMGVWLSILLAIAFIGLHAWQITEESRQLADALAATELVLAREQHLSQLDGLAAAAAHELGTPLATSTLIEEVVAPHRNFGVAINVALSAGEAAEPVGGRNPAILYGLGNLLENAVDFAHERVEVAASWNGQDVAVTITDDGPGFAPEIMDRIGEPYVTSRRRHGGESEASGLGLGFFIAKTLLERSGATLDFENRAFPDRGAIVRVHWGRREFERAT